MYSLFLSDENTTQGNTVTKTLTPNLSQFFVLFSLVRYEPCADRALASTARDDGAKTTDHSGCVCYQSLWVNFPGENYENGEILVILLHLVLKYYIFGLLSLPRTILTIIFQYYLIT